MKKKQEDILLGKRIKHIRVSLNMDQKTFSEKIGSTVSALSNWENGRNKPNDIMLNAIANSANISVDELLSPSLEDSIKQYLEEIQTFEIRQGDQKYKILYDPREKAKLYSYLLKQNYSSLSIQYGVRYYVKELIERYLDRKIELEGYIPYSNENACSYTDYLIREIDKKLTDYFKIDEVNPKDIGDYLRDDQIKTELSPILYHKLREELFNTRSKISEIDNS